MPFLRVLSLVSDGLLFFLAVPQCLTQVPSTKNCSGIAQGIYFPTFALRFGGRWGDGKQEQLARKKVLFFSCGREKFFYLCTPLRRKRERLKRGDGEGEKMKRDK